LRSLYCSSDGVRGRGAPVTNLHHNASFHSSERISPTNHGIKHPWRAYGEWWQALNCLQNVVADCTHEKKSVSQRLYCAKA
jgi:hypothetical protein